jgi:hypothetical protein
VKGWKGVDDLFKGGGFGDSLGQGLDKALAGEQYQAGSAKFLDGITLGITHFSDVYKTSEGQFDALGQQLAGLAQQDFGAASSSFADLVQKYHLGADDTKRLLDLMPAYRDELVKQADAAGVSASDHNLLLIAQGKGAVGAKVLASAQEEAAHSAAAQAAGLDQLAGTATSAKVDVKALSDAIKGFGSTTLDARSAQRDFEKAVDDARAAAKKAGDASKDSTQADRDKQASLDDVAQSALAAAAAFAKQPGGVHKAEEALKDGRKAFVDIATEMLGSKKKADALADSLGLIPGNVRTAYGLSGTDAALSDIAEIQRALDRIHNKSVTVTVNQDGSTGTAYSDSRESVPRRAAGGPIDGPGAKGVDSVYAVLAPGEHVLTAQEVDRMGGQAAVSAFRADLMHFAKGGPVNAITEAQNIADEGAGQADYDTGRIQEAKRKAKAARKRADDLQDDYQDIDGTKKNRARKKAAKAAAEAADKRADAAEKAVDKERDFRDQAIKQRDEYRAKVVDLKQQSEDFVSSERRGGQDPLGYVDQLRSMSRDDNYSKKQRDACDKQANDAETKITATMRQQDAYTKSIADATKVQDANKDALDKTKATLDDTTSALSALQSTAQQFASGISSGISGQYQAGSAVTAATAGTEAGPDRQVQSGWVTRNGIRMRNIVTVKGAAATPGDPGGATTVGTLSDYYSRAANDTGVFAGQLQQLATRGTDRKLLAEIAGYGPDKGGQIARALLAANDSQFQSINNNYAATLVNSDRAGSLLSNYTYGSQISDAQGAVASAQAAYALQQDVVDKQQKLIDGQQAAADQITAALTGDGDSLKTVIGQAFGLKGYATGTDSATAGVHWVGENGPELVGFGGGEKVLSAEQSRRWVRGGGSAANGGAGEQRIVVEWPQELALRDADGAFVGMVRTEARGVASQVVTERHEDLAVRLMGGSQ